MRADLKRIALGPVVLRAVIAGCTLTALLAGTVVLATSSGAATVRAVAGCLANLLGPGVLAAYACGARRVQELSFWCLALVLNAVFYSGVFFVVERLWRRRRTSFTTEL